MRWNRPTIESVMTPTPISVGPEEPLSRAAQGMAVHRVRHLPVCQAGGVIGVVSQRDILRAAQDPDERPRTRVCDAMNAFVYTVGPQTPLEEVAADLADTKYGAAIVVEGGLPVGIFTTTDALRVLSEILGDLRRDAKAARPLDDRSIALVGGER
jgi:acetoin utilization protein AcuB